MATFFNYFVAIGGPIIALIYLFIPPVKDPKRRRVLRWLGGIALMFFIALYALAYQAARARAAKAHAVAPAATEEGTSR